MPAKGLPLKLPKPFNLHIGERPGRKKTREKSIVAEYKLLLVFNHSGKSKMTGATKIYNTNYFTHSKPSMTVSKQFSNILFRRQSMTILLENIF